MSVKISVAGTKPPGTANEQQASAWVQRTFADVAPKYDLLNHLLAFNIDRGWRMHLRKRLTEVLQQHDAKILDLCCGTGDVLLDLQQNAKAPVMGADFCHPMLVTAQRKVAHRRFCSPLFEGDALRLPLRGASLDAISIAFGFRNLANYAEGLRELHRVLKPGGRLAILEFSHPQNPIVRAGYGFYSTVLLPVIGSLVSGTRSAYQYLPESISVFPSAGELLKMMEAAGFRSTEYDLLTGGIVALHLGSK